MQFIPAKNFTPAVGRDINHVIIHTMEAPEGANTAESVSRWAAGPTAPKASWHYAVDANSVVQCVLEKDVAWAAPGANHDGIQVELAGRAGQTAAQWADADSKATLALAALLTADVCKRHDIPAVRLTVADMIAGRRGITGHHTVSLAFKGSSHWDPGPAFPWDAFIGMVREAMKPKILRNWPVPLPKWWWAWNLWLEKGKVGPRPADAPRIIPLWAWARRRAFLAAKG